MTAESPATNVMSSLAALCKRRGFVFPSSEIYGGMNGFWDYGPLGTALKNNLRDAWWKAMVDCPPSGPDGKPLQIFGLDSSIILNPRVWQASGHTEGFHDLLVDCRETKARYRADHLLCYPVSVPETTFRWVAVIDGDDLDSRVAKRMDELRRRFRGLAPATGAAAAFSELPADERPAVVAPGTSTPGTLTQPRAFNLMLSTSVGAMESSETQAYLRPETAQGIFINFKNVVDSTRGKMPFGIAQIGKAFRNEITPRNFIFRSREFEQMELEWFCPPEQSPEWFHFWVEQRRQWWLKIGVRTDNLSLRPHGADELAHYSTACTDIEYRYPFSQGGFGELEGVAHRGAFDLTRHQEFSRQKLQYSDLIAKTSYLPHVIEPSSGLTRGVLAVLCDAYSYDESRPSPETLRLAPSLAPVKLGIFSLTGKDGMPEMAEKIFDYFRTRFPVQFDAKQSIGKRYARMDEIGTPLCVTIDGQSLQDGTVTVRDRDTCEQVRIAGGQLEAYVYDKLGLPATGGLEAALSGAT